MKRKAVRAVLGMLLSTAVIWSLSGCGQRVTQETETEAKQTETEVVTEAVTETEKEKETETEVQKLITSVDYTSKDGSVKITLPDNTWKVTQDADEMRVFQSGTAAIINIVHATTDTALKNLAVMTSEEDLDASLTKQYSDSTAYEIQNFTTVNVNGVNLYRYVVKYNLAARMWAYSVTNAVVAADEAYVVTGTVTDDNETLLKAVQKAVESFKVLDDETLKAATGQQISGSTEPIKTTDQVNKDTQSAQELTSLKDYGTQATLVTNDTVNMRSQPGLDGEVMTTLGKNESVTVVGETSNWFKVNINGNVGYIRKDFLVYGNKNNNQSETQADAPASSDVQSQAEIGTATHYGAATTLYATSEVNVRTAPGTDSSVAGGLSSGTAVMVIGETDNWFIVSINGSTGYVSKSYLTTDSSVSTGATADQQITNMDGSGNGGNNGNGGSSGNGSGMSSLSGTVVGTTADSITVQGSDGKNYTVYYGDANVSTQDGLYTGVSVNISLDSTQASGDGTLYATNVTGN